MKRERRTFRYIGSVVNDSGLISIGDPCYVYPHHEDGSAPVLVEMTKNWKGFCLLVEEGNGTKNFDETAIVISPDGGEVEGRVYAAFTPYGRVTEVRIRFDELEDEPEGDFEDEIEWEDDTEW